MRAGAALLATLAGSMLLDALEVSVVLVALPDAAMGLGLSLFEVQWLMGGFAAGFAAVLLLGPTATARWGLRTPYVAALALFAVASVAGGLSGDAVVVIASRAVKGACAALTAPAGLAVIGATYPAGPARQRAVTVYSLFGAAGFTTGLLVSGAVTAAGWQWVILLPAPAAVALAVFAARLVPAARPAAPGGVRALRRVLRRVLAAPGLLSAAAGAALLNGSLLGSLLLTVFVLREDLGFPPWLVAVSLLPACVPLAVLSPVVGRRSSVSGTGPPIVAGAVAALAGLGWLSWAAPAGGYGSGVLPGLVALGVGLALSFGPLNMQAVSAVPDGDRAMAVALYQTAVQCGAVVLLACTSALGVGAAPPVLTLCGAVALAIALTGILTRPTRKLVI